MLRRTFLAFLVLVIVALGAVDAYAHGGGLDGMGCHHNRKTGGYHCHRGPLAGQQFNDKSEAIRALQKLEGSVIQAPAPAAPLAPSETIVGVATVIDGDNIELHGQSIRLYGIDAPESSQLCEASGKQYRCGQRAALALADLIDRHTVSCLQRDTDRYGRIVATCTVGGQDIGASLVRQGWALAFRRYSAEYVPIEDAAREARAGIWAGTFDFPWDWRKTH